MNPTRTFRVPSGRLVTLPAALTQGVANTRVVGGATITLEVARIRRFQRFIANRIKLGDLVEVTASASTPSSPASPGKE